MKKSPFTWGSWIATEKQGKVFTCEVAGEKLVGSYNNNPKSALDGTIRGDATIDGSLIKVQGAKPCSTGISGTLTEIPAKLRGRAFY